MTLWESVIVPLEGECREMKCTNLRTVAVLAIGGILLSVGVCSASLSTIATFSDPAPDSDFGFFTVAWDDVPGLNATGSIFALWESGIGDPQLDLKLPNIVLPEDTELTNVKMALDPVPFQTAYYGGPSFYVLETTLPEGTTAKVEFYNADLPGSDPLLVLEFTKAFITPFGFSSADMTSEETLALTNGASDDAIDVNIDGLVLAGTPLVDESFSFSFTNRTPIDGSWLNGFESTASFTSSATIIPEPVSMSLLALGCTCLLRRRQR